MNLITRLVVLSLGLFLMTFVSSNSDAMYDPGSGRFCSRDPIGFKAGDENIYRFAIGNAPVGLDPMGLELPWKDFPYPRRNRVYPLDGRPIDWWKPYSSYNCAGLALRTYEYEGDREKVKEKLSQYESPCDQDCKCGETKCRLWQWVTRLYNRETGKFAAEMDRDFHIVCSKIPDSPGNETGPEPRCYQKFGEGPITGPIDPSNAEPGPENIPNVPKSYEARLEDMKETCYCLPKSGGK